MGEYKLKKPSSGKPRILLPRRGGNKNMVSDLVTFIWFYATISINDYVIPMQCNKTSVKNSKKASNKASLYITAIIGPPLAQPFGTKILPTCSSNCIGVGFDVVLAK